MGPSGIGKTTLLRLIGGQIHQIMVRFFSMVRIFRRCLVRPVYSAQTDEHVISVRGVVHYMNVFDNVAYPLREHTQLPAHCCIVR